MRDGPWRGNLNGSILPLQQPSPWALFSSGVGVKGVLVTHPFYRHLLEIFRLLLGDTKRVKLFIYSKLFICVLEISNPGGPPISMIF